MKKTIDYCDMCGYEVIGCNSLQGRARFVNEQFRSTDPDERLESIYSKLETKTHKDEHVDLCRKCRDNLILEWSRIIEKERSKVEEP